MAICILRSKTFIPKPCSQCQSVTLSSGDILWPHPLVFIVSSMDPTTSMGPMADSRLWPCTVVFKTACWDPKTTSKVMLCSGHNTWPYDYDFLTILGARWHKTKPAKPGIRHFPLSREDATFSGKIVMLSLLHWLTLHTVLCLCLVQKALAKMCPPCVCSDLKLWLVKLCVSGIWNQWNHETIEKIGRCVKFF